MSSYFWLTETVLEIFIERVDANVYGDLSKEHTWEFEFEVMNYREPMYRETKRALNGMDGAERRSGQELRYQPRQATAFEPETVKRAVLAGFQAGADGVLLSRNYIEMKPETLAGTSKSIAELVSA